MRAYRPTDATTNPSLILKVVQQAAYRPLLDRVIADHPHASLTETSDLLLVAFGRQILDIVPGRVSTEVDARLSLIRWPASSVPAISSSITKSRYRP